LSKPKQFDDAAQVIGSAGLDHCDAGRHDNLDEVPLSLSRALRQAHQGTGWYSFDQKASISSV
jgi:hypothetical protein